VANATTAQLIQLTRDVIESRLTGGAVRSYVIADRDLAYEPLPNLIRLLQALYQAQSDEQGLQIVYAQFEEAGPASTT
jgi:hypothetical protein